MHWREERRKRWCSMPSVNSMQHLLRIFLVPGSPCAQFLNLLQHTPLLRWDSPPLPGFSLEWGNGSTFLCHTEVRRLSWWGCVKLYLPYTLQPCSPWAFDHQRTWTRWFLCSKTLKNCLAFPDQEQSACLYFSLSHSLSLSPLSLLFFLSPSQTSQLSLFLSLHFSLNKVQEIFVVCLRW